MADQASHGDVDIGARRPTGMSWLMAGVVVSAVVAVVVAGGWFTRGPSASLPATALALALFFVGERATFSIRFGRHRVGFAFGEAALVLGLVLVPPAYVIVFGGLGAAIAHLVRRRGLTKCVFNACNSAAGAGLATGAALLAGLRMPASYRMPFSVGWLDWLSPRNQLALLAAAVVFSIWTTTTSAAAVALSQRMAFVPVWRRALPTNVLVGVGNAAIAFGVLALARYSPISLIVLPLMLICIHTAYRGYLRAQDEREAWQQLDAATRDLSRLDESAALTSAVVRAAQLFRAEHAEIALSADARTASSARWVRGDVNGVRERRNDYVPSAPGQVTTPLRTPGRLLGELRLSFGGPVELSTREDRIFSTFAYSVASTLLSARLFEQTKAEAQRAAFEAAHDDLTGLANRNLLQQRTSEALVAVGPSDVCALLLLDIVHFRQVNETLGHDAGDELLREIARRLSAVSRRSDTVARIGGNEFAVLLTDLREPASAEAIAAGVLRALAAPVTLAGVQLSVEASLGLACSPKHASTTTQLLRCAEVAAHHAKSQPGSVQCYSADRDASSLDRLTLVGELHAALEERQLVVYFQPKIDLADSAIVGAEALVRWDHPRRGVLTPVDFVPAVETSGLIGAFTDHVLELAITECAHWPAVVDGPSVAVNLSSRNLLDAGLPDRIAVLLRSASLPAHRLILEITETTMMSQLDVVDEVLAALAALGVQISLDDFGTGYSSLTFLSRVHVQEVKIDRVFVASMLESAGDAAIVRATIDLAHSFGMRVVAEGVQNVAQQRELRDLGCDVAQGYHLGVPMPAADFRDVLTTSRDAERPVACPVIHLPAAGER